MVQIEEVAANNLNRLKSIATVSAGSATLDSHAYQYSDANQRTRVDVGGTSYPSPTYWRYGYDALGQVTSGKRNWTGGAPVAGQQFEYTFDDIGNRETAKLGGDQFGANLRPMNYAANLLNQYTNHTVPAAVDIIGDANSNATVTVNLQPVVRQGEYFWKELAVSNASASVWQSVTNIGVLNNGTNADIVTTNLGNVLVAKNPEAFTYDLDGNLTSDGLWTNRWNGENQLIEMESLASVPGAARLKLAFAYDYRGRRIRKIVSTWNGTNYVAQLTNKFVYDGWNLLAELNHTNGLIRSYRWGLDLSGSEQGAGGVGGLLAVSATTNGTHFTVFDGNGNVSALVNATNATVSAQFDYGAFGEPIGAYGAMGGLMPLTFSTKYYDAETRAYNYGYRYLLDGRWFSRDPIEELGGKNLNSFSGNDSVNKIDPLGLEIECKCPEAYFKDLGLKKDEHYTVKGNSYAAVSGAFNPIGNLDALIIWRMLSTKHSFKANGLEVAELKKHVAARKTIANNALNSNFIFDTGNKLDWSGFRQDPQAFFDRLNNGETEIACTALTLIIFESGNKLNPTKARNWDGVWIPGDWGYIRNKAFKSPEWDGALSGENVIHAGLDSWGWGDLFWGHFTDRKHPAMPERAWWVEAKSWRSKDGREKGDPEWRSEIVFPGIGLEPYGKPQ